MPAKVNRRHFIAAGTATAELPAWMEAGLTPGLPSA
jgi:hypothetical protein